MPEQEAAQLTVRQEIVVRAPRERAFEVFTARLASWWPLAQYSIGSAPAVDAVLEPRAGGRWYERGEDGSECAWGHVRAWEPPERVVLSWEIDAAWQANPACDSEIEVTFHAEDAERTRVVLVHRNLEVFGEHAGEMRNTLEGEGGWGGVLDAYAAVAEA